MQIDAASNAVLSPAAAKGLIEARTGPFIGLLSIIAILSSSLEIELLEHLDSLSSYMRFKEIALDGGVALLLVIAAASLWWLCMMLLAAAGRRTLLSREQGISLAWRLCLIPPLIYFTTDLVNAAVRVRLGYHPKLHVWAIVVVGIVVLCSVWVCSLPILKLQKFCRQRLAPIGWIHILLSVMALIALRFHGVYLFHDYARVGTPSAPSALPDVYLITFDALRADEMSLYGYSRPTTPNLDRFAGRCTTFDYFFANSNFTTATTTSIETGQLPWRHRVRQGGAFLQLEDQNKTLASVLKKHGYYTAMVTANFFAGPFRHRTLDSYDAVSHVTQDNLFGPWSRYTNLIGTNAQHTLTVPLFEFVTGVRRYVDALLFPDTYPSSPEVVFSRSRQLLERSDISQPRFLWAHVLAPHDPYLPPPPYRHRFGSGSELNRNLDFIDLNTSSPPAGVSVAALRARYDEMVLYGDAALGQFLDWLDETGRMNKAVVIISADHGEAFEHGWFTHTGPYLYNDLIRIPLMIHLPSQQTGKRTDWAAEQADLLPTILDIVGINSPEWTDGVSLKPTLKSGTPTKRYIFSMNLEHTSNFSPIQSGTVAVMDDEFKYVSYLGEQKDELYRYKLDPGESHNLIASEIATAQRMRAVLADTLKDANDRFTLAR
ncbi:MAG TPA: sulfatase-like hydrolase/transferase [Terriglobales bacterium]|jgi:arylsulfatase A-like enzyme